MEIDTVKSPDNALEVYCEFESARLDNMSTKFGIGAKVYRGTKLHYRKK